MINELKAELNNHKNSKERSSFLIRLCDQGYNLHADTLLKYADELMMQAEKENNTFQKAQALYFKSAAYTTKGLIDTSLALATASKKLLETSTPDPVLLANILNQQGRCYMRRNEYNHAIDMGYQVIRAGEIAGDPLIQVKGKTLIGWAYLEMGRLNMALLWHLRAIHTTTDTVLVKKYGIVFANLALNYLNLGIKDSAAYFIDKAITASREYENLFALSNSLAIQSQLFIRTGKPASAEAPLKEVIAIRKLIGDPFYIVSDMSQLGLYYAHYGMPEKGVEVCKEGINIASRYQLDSKLIFLYSSLGENYKALKDTTAYASVLEKIIALKDTVFQKNSAQALAEIEAKYELEKKQSFIMEQTLKISRQRYILYGLIILAVFAALVSWFLFKLYKKRQQLILLRLQEEEKQQSALAVIKAGETERKRIAADLHDNLGAYAASIASNIDNIRLKEKNEANDMVLKELRNNSAAIVSQLIDTIWVLKKDNLSFTAISDRIKVFIQRLHPGFPGIQIEVKENIVSDIIMPSSKAYHLYRLIQETIMLSVKTNDVQKIYVIMESTKHWKVTVSNDSNEDNIGHLIHLNIRSAETGFFTGRVKNGNGRYDLQIIPTTN